MLGLHPAQFDPHRGKNRMSEVLLKVGIEKYN